jgi:dUTP pyrophosphatase
MQLKFTKLHPAAFTPKYQTKGAACFDLHAVLDPLQAEVPWPVRRGESAKFPTGLAFEVPEGYVMLIYSRSGHGFKNGIRLSNCTGVIDSDYRGEILVSLQNDGFCTFFVKHGDRIAQALLIPVQQFELSEVEELSSTERGTNGFGSTGSE